MYIADMICGSFPKYQISHYILVYLEQYFHTVTVYIESSYCKYLSDFRLLNAAQNHNGSG